MAGRDNPGRYHGAPTGNRKEPMWAHEVRGRIPQAAFMPPSGNQQQSVGPKNVGTTPKSADPFKAQ